MQIRTPSSGSQREDLGTTADALGLDRVIRCLAGIKESNLLRSSGLRERKPNRRLY